MLSYLPLLTFEQQWTDEASGRTLPRFVTEELHKYLACGILGRVSRTSTARRVASTTSWRKVDSRRLAGLRR